MCVGDRSEVFRLPPRPNAPPSEMGSPEMASGSRAPGEGRLGALAARGGGAHSGLNRHESARPRGQGKSLCVGGIIFRRAEAWSCDGGTAGRRTGPAGDP